ncbi:MAG: HDOD domain-containing protein [Proteobacteria bacterium]|nr:HDOD domain-containing protein [Pseudomonadota bacterium]
MATIARAIAVRTGAAAPDVALLAGLLHNIGSVYLLARADKHVALFRTAATRDVLMHDRQAPIGKAIAQNWGCLMSSPTRSASRTRSIGTMPERAT